MSDALDPRVERLFAQALAVTDARREALVRERAGGDVALEREVRSLLAAHGSADDFLLGAAVRSPPEPIEIAGRFRILGTIGEGAMGTVYLAEQFEPVRRTVALKVVRAGLLAPGALRRFETERQSVARMNHAGIARLFDSGTTDDGRPWFAMEHVAGEPITTFCAARELSLFARVWLVIAVCRAVHHAHGRGVIHRDLKPGNVLVTEEDGRPVPKVIDFGVAKTALPLGQGESQTGHGELVGTLEYMSPEQALGVEGGVDARTDVYAIGAILYELITGEQPLPIRSARAAGLAGVTRVLREAEPLPPSRQLELAAAAERDPARRAWARAESRRVCGDLDWIALAAVEKDRARRYPSAAALADDLERFLRREPVSVAPPGRIYRLRKFERRHRAALLSGAMVFASLLIGLLVALAQAREAGRQRDTALQVERDVRRTLQEFTSFLGALVHKTDEQLADLVGGARARHEFARWALATVEPFARRPDAPGEMRLVLGYAEQRVGEAELALGRPSAALESFRRSLARRELDLALRPGVITRRTLAVGHWKVGQGLDAIGDRVAAEAHHAEALALLQALDADGGLASGEAETYLGIGLQRLASARAALEDDAAALELFATALATLERGLAIWPDHAPLKRERILALAGSAEVLARCGRATEADPRLELALAELDAMEALASPISVWAPTQRARCLLVRGELARTRSDPGAALRDVALAVEIARALEAGDRDNFESKLLAAQARSALGDVLLCAGRRAESREILQEASAALEALTAAAGDHVPARRAHALACARLSVASGGVDTETGSAWSRRADEIVAQLERAAALTSADRARFAELRVTSRATPEPAGGH